jgi:hypothetical protein
VADKKVKNEPSILLAVQLLQDVKIKVKAKHGVKQNDEIT